MVWMEDSSSSSWCGKKPPLSIGADFVKASVGDLLCVLGLKIRYLKDLPHNNNIIVMTINENNYIYITR